MASVQHLGFGFVLALAGCTAILGDNFFIETASPQGEGGGDGGGAETTSAAGMGGGEIPCTQDEDCPDDECNEGECSEVCMLVPVAAGVPCSEGACDGAGMCRCTDDADCATSATCMPPAQCTCNANTCEDSLAWALALDPGAGTADVTGMAMDAQGNITIAGVFDDVLTFPEDSTAASGTAATLTSDGGRTYGFVTSYDRAGEFRWAVSLETDDTVISGLRIAAIDNTNVFIAGRYSGEARWVGVSNGGTLPPPTGSGAAFLAVLNFDGVDVSATRSAPLATTASGAPAGGQSISDVACAGDSCYFGGLFTSGFTTGGPSEFPSPSQLNIGAFHGAVRPGTDGLRWIRWLGGGFIFVPRISATPGRVFNATRFGTRLEMYNQNGSRLFAHVAQDGLAFFSWDSDSGNRQESFHDLAASGGGRRSLAASDEGLVFAFDVTADITYEGQSYVVDGSDGALIGHQGRVEGPNPFPLAHMSGPGDVTNPQVVRAEDGFRFAATFTGDFALGAATHSAAPDDAGIVVVRLGPRGVTATSSLAYAHTGAESVATSGIGTDGQTTGVAAVMGEGVLDFGNGRVLSRNRSCPGLEQTCVPIIFRLNR